MENKNYVRKEDITRKVKTLDIDIRTNPDSAWNTTSYVPLSMIKLLISETFAKFGKDNLSQETLEDLQSVLNIEEI